MTASDFNCRVAAFHDADDVLADDLLTLCRDVPLDADAERDRLEALCVGLLEGAVHCSAGRPRSLSPASRDSQPANARAGWPGPAGLGPSAPGRRTIRIAGRLAVWMMKHAFAPRRAASSNFRSSGLVGQRRAGEEFRIVRRRLVGEEDDDLPFTSTPL